MERQAHWDTVYGTRRTDEVGWYEADPRISRQLVEQAVATGARSVVDIGGGASSLVDHLLELDLDRVGVLDLAPAALAVTQGRLGARAAAVTWIVGDVSALEDIGRWDVWHDRAVFHFLLEAEDRRRYVALASSTIPAGGTAIIATFAPDGPERCSGLPVRRYGPQDLAAELGPGFRLEASIRHDHTTPGGTLQRYQYATFRRA